MTRISSLFATDLDGSLVDRQDRIHARDKEAVHEARESGIEVTLATGRLSTRTLHIARELGIRVPVICADGAMVVCPTTQHVVQQALLEATLVEQALAACEAQGIAGFVFDHSKIIGCSRGKPHHDYIRGWAHQIEVDLEFHARRKFHASTVLMLVAIGPEANLAEVHAEIAPLAQQYDLLSYCVSNHRVMRLVTAGVDKGTGLSKVALDLGVGMDATACLGDWLNDLPMFEKAGCSFAMPHAPGEVKAKATHVLQPDDVARGPLSAALRVWRTRPAMTLG